MAGRAGGIQVRQPRFPTGEPVDFLVVGAARRAASWRRSCRSTALASSCWSRARTSRATDFRHDEDRELLPAGLTNDHGASSRIRSAKTDKDAAKKQPRSGTDGWSAAARVHFTANYWRFHEIDFVERTRIGPDRRHRLRDWPHDVRGTGAVLHEARIGDRRVGLDGANPFDPPRSKPYPLPPLPVKSSGVLFERGAQKAGAASVSGAACDHLAALSRPAGVHALRILRRVRLRDRREIEHAGDDDSGGGGDRPLRNPVRTATCARSRSTRTGRATGVVYFDAEQRERSQKARAVVVCANGAETPRLLLMSESKRFPQGWRTRAGWSAST